MAAQIIITDLHGSAEVEFLRRGIVVHRERFTGKCTGEYKRTIRTTEVWEDHRCRVITSGRDLAFQYRIQL